MAIWAFCSAVLFFVLAVDIGVSSMSILEHVIQGQAFSASVLTPERKIPSFARKAGGTLKKISTTTSTPTPTEIAEGVTITPGEIYANSIERKNAIEDIYTADDSESTESDEECPDGQYWHIRGHSCVPESCPGGNSYRDANSGECLYTKSEYKNRNRINRQEDLCSYCIEHNIHPYRLCCIKLMQQPHLASGQFASVHIIGGSHHKVRIIPMRRG